MNKLFFLFQVVLFAACSQSPERGVKVTLEMSGLEAGELINFAAQSNLNDKETVPALAGKTTFHIPIKAGEGDWYRIWIGSSPLPSNDMVIYMDSGEVNIISTQGGFTNAEYSGSPDAIEYNEFLKTLKNAEKSKVEQTIRQWVFDRPGSALSTALLEKYKSGPIPADTAIAYFAQRSSFALNNKPAQRLRDWMHATADILPGKPAPEFIQPDGTGNPVSLKDYKGKYVLIDFWASWCIPCRVENRNLIEVYAKFKDKGFDILGVSLDESDAKDKWLAAIQKDQLTWKQVSDLKGWDNGAAKLYHVNTIPANFLIDPDGVIIARDLKGADLDNKLKEIFL